MSKIGLIESFILVSFVAIAELLELIVTLAVGPGEVVKWFINIIVWLPVQFWLLFRGARGDLYALSVLIEFIPFVNALPIKTALLITTIYIHNHPESAAAKTVHTAQEVMPVKKPRRKPKPKIKKKSKVRMATKVITKI
ncbi:TPA: hypothetical protein DGT35_00070 [Patescibacteria group bacterium]|nr:hypothetical protein [Patescibacteria group bacterium]|tara:strand:+ start:310 stop:726 length:417 start_codon:yes stop_codon:yes gene_type:complete